METNPNDELPAPEAQEEGEDTTESATFTNDPLPSAEQRDHLTVMYYHAFVELRLLSWGGHSEQAADLADAFHNLPADTFREANFSWAFLRNQLESYQIKWRGKSAIGGRNYAEMLDEIRAFTKQS